MGNTMTFRYESATAVLTWFDLGLVSLHNVWADIPGQGHGKAVMKLVTDYADDNELTLLVMVQAYGDPHRKMLSNQALEYFYTKFYFEVQPGFKRPTRMIRYPSRKIHGP